MDSRKTKTKRPRKTTIIHGMEEEQVVQAFETLAMTLDIEVRYEKGDFRSAMCRVGEENLIILQKDADPLKKINVFAKEFCNINLDDIYVVPALKNIIQEMKDSENSVPEVK